MVEKIVVDESRKATKGVTKGVEGLAKIAWSIMDAASKKRTPSEYLSQRDIRAMQGN